jgi:hypothetical protein
MRIALFQASCSITKYQSPSRQILAQHSSTTKWKWYLSSGAAKEIKCYKLLLIQT